MKKVQVLAAVLLLGCQEPKAPRPIDGTENCSAAETKLLELQCKDSRGELLGGKNKKGQTFTQRCERIQNNGVSLNPTCLKDITSCERIDACLTE